METLLLFVAENTLAVLIATALIGLCSIAAAILQHRRSVDRRALRARILRWLVAGVGAALFGFSAWVSSQVGPSLLAQISMRGEIPPELTYVDLDSGQTGSVSELRGQVVVLNFWATWCPPCREEMPDLDRLQIDLADRGLQIVHISDEREEKLRQWMESQPMSTIHGRVDELPWPEWGRPTSYIIDRSGIVQEIIQGPRTYEQMQEILSPWLMDG